MISYLQRAICKFEYARRTRHIICTHTHTHTHSGTRTHRGTETETHRRTQRQLEPHNRSRIGFRMLSSVVQAAPMRFHCVRAPLSFVLSLSRFVCVCVRGEVKTSGNCFCMSALAARHGQSSRKKEAAAIAKGIGQRRKMY